MYYWCLSILNLGPVTALYTPVFLKLALVPLQPRLLSSLSFPPKSGIWLLMKNKDAVDGPATKLEPASGVATDPFIIASFRAVGELAEGIGLITSYIWEGSGGPARSWKSSTQSYRLYHVLHRCVTLHFTKPLHLIFFFPPKARKLSLYLTLSKTFRGSKSKTHFI